MNDLSDERVLELLRSALPPCAGADPPENLWPRVRLQIDAAPTDLPEVIAC